MRYCSNSKTMGYFIVSLQRADLSTSPLTINSERLRVLEFSKPFMQFTMSLISKKLDTNDHDLTTFMLPYSTEVWLLTLACLLFVTVLMYLVNFFSPYGHRSRHKHHGETGEEFDFYNSLWFCLASMLQQGADHTPKSFSGEFAFGTPKFNKLPEGLKVVQTVTKKLDKDIENDLLKVIII